AMMNYTYYPWNQTSGAPLVYSTPQQINLKGNSSTITSLSYDFSSATKNITSISFDTNQSAHLTYDVTLSYIKVSTASSSWDVTSSGGLVQWESILTMSYPSVSGQVSRFLNVSAASSWDIEGLYESSAPTTNHTDYSRTGNIVTCSSMTDGTWNLTATSYNHLVSVATYDSADDSVITSLSSILIDIDVNLTLQEEDSDFVETGFANLTIVKDESAIWSPSNKSVSSGAANYLWNIDSTTSDNGAFTLEVSWANGTDAGYMTRVITVFYPTSFTTSTPVIDAYTESTFDVKVYLEDTFTPQGLDGTDAAVEYSFDGGTNTSLFDHNNGTWTASISTAGKAPGSYLVDIFGEGYALQNRSLQVTVSLIHDTETFTILWSNTNDITYIESTELSVAYNRVGGTPINGATVNVTIDSIPYELTWDGGSETYKKTFLGSDTLPGFGIHDLYIQAWKDGHKPQTDDTQILTIQKVPTTLDLEWSHGNNITYVESTTLIANYTMSDGPPVLGAWINVTIGSNTWNLTWNGATETYEYVFDGDADPPSFGIYSATVEADKFGYTDKSTGAVALTIREEPTTLVLTWSTDYNLTYVETTYLIANYTMSNGSAVLSAVINVTIDTLPLSLDWYAPTQTYRVLFTGSDDPPGLGTHSMIVKADLSGYISKTNDTEQLIIREEPTSLVLSWSNGNDITYIESTTLIANYTMSDSSPVLGAWINVTIGSNTWNLTWNGLTEVYEYVFHGDADPPGLDTHSLTVEAYIFGYEYISTTSVPLTLREEPTSLVL
ncbi:MAG: hypothetical protein ACXABX_09345, partial [Candidatus Thorarchaeota archaeon]